VVFGCSGEGVRCLGVEMFDDFVVFFVVFGDVVDGFGECVVAVYELLVDLVMMFFVVVLFELVLVEEVLFFFCWFVFVGMLCGVLIVNCVWVLVDLVVVVDMVMLVVGYGGDRVLVVKLLRVLLELCLFVWVMCCLVSLMVCCFILMLISMSVGVGLSF